MENFKNLEAYINDLKVYISDKRGDLVNYIEAKREMLAEVSSRAVSSVKGFVKKTGKKVVKGVAAVGMAGCVLFASTGCGVQLEDGHVKAWGNKICCEDGCECSANASDDTKDTTNSTETEKKPIETADPDWAIIIKGSGNEGSGSSNCKKEEETTISEDTKKKIGKMWVVIGENSEDLKEPIETTTETEKDSDKTSGETSSCVGEGDAVKSEEELFYGCLIPAPEPVPEPVE